MLSGCWQMQMQTHVAFLKKSTKKASSKLVPSAIILRRCLYFLTLVILNLYVSISDKLPGIKTHDWAIPFHVNGTVIRVPEENSPRACSSWRKRAKISARTVRLMILTHCCSNEED